MSHEFDEADPISKITKGIVAQDDNPQIISDNQINHVIQTCDARKGVSFHECYARLSSIRGPAIVAYAMSHLPQVKAQGVIVSSTAAWSSQIVAFWGAVGLGARLSSSMKVANPFTSLFSMITIMGRVSLITKSLQADSWFYISSGYRGGIVRLHVALITWRTEADLRRQALRVATLAEAAGRQKWAILVLGRKLRTQDSDLPSRIYWTMAPRSALYSTVRVKDTGEHVAVLSDEAIGELANMVETNPSDLDGVITLLATQPRPATRAAMFVEVHPEVQKTTTLARHMTGWDQPDTQSPYISLHRLTHVFGTARTGQVRAASYLYVIVHITAAVAVALMAAATGRGLAVWFFSTRIVISQISGAAFAGDDTALTLLSFDSVQVVMETSAGDILFAGDSILPPMQWRSIILVLFINLAEIALIGGGWVYGSLTAQRFKPTGVVGHGMLWLAIVVGLALAIRTLVGIRERLVSRLIGIFNEAGAVRHVIPRDVVITPKIGSGAALDSGSPATSRCAPMTLASLILRQGTDDASVITAALPLLRMPIFACGTEAFVVKEVLGYKYDGDRLASSSTRALVPSRARWPLWLSSLLSADDTKGDKEKQSDAETAKIISKELSTVSVYPWKTIVLLVIILGLCTAVSAAYAYLFAIPEWAKMMVEVVVSIGAVAFATLDRTCELQHLQVSYLSFMVASMVISSVWYVGVEGVG